MGDIDPTESGQRREPPGADVHVRRLVDSLLDVDVEVEIDGPHVVVFHDRDGSSWSYTGPYPSGLAALEAAESQASWDRESAGRGEFVVAPLLTPWEPWLRR